MGRRNFVTVDFSENHLFSKVLPKDSTGTNPGLQSTLLLPNLNSGELCCLSYVIISDCLHHDTTAVYLFQKCFNVLMFFFYSIPESFSRYRIAT